MAVAKAETQVSARLRSDGPAVGIPACSCSNSRLMFSSSSRHVRGTVIGGSICGGGGGGGGGGIIMTRGRAGGGGGSCNSPVTSVAASAVVIAVKPRPTSSPQAAS